MPQRPPIITSSSIIQCPAIALELTTITRSPIWASWAIWQPAINNPSSPTRVCAPPPAVPVFIVTCSRIRLRLPIRKRVFSPQNFKSCGISPMTENGNTMVSSPICVSPVTTTWDFNSTAAPSTTSAPMTQNGPIWQPSPMTAPSSITAEGWIIPIRSSNPSWL